MTQLREMTDEEYHCTMVSPMREARDYRLPESSLDAYCESWIDVLAAKHGVTDLNIEHIWVNGPESHEHIVFKTNHRRVYLVIVHDLHANRVAGHHLLDINEKYGLPSPLEELGLI
jgi:hypothetical protein